MINIKYNTNTMREMIENIKKELHAESALVNELHVANMYPDFYNDYPFLVKKICKKSDLTFLYKMLDKLDDIDNGKDNITNVEKKLGEELASQYLPPELNKK